jgi:hypothetical protein
MRNKMLMAVACLGAAIGSAQTLETTVKVNLPHDTKVGKVSLPAGKYSIKEVTNSVIEISSDDRKGPSVFAIVNTVSTPDGERADHTKVTLREEENGTYDLKDIWLEGRDLGFELE